MARDVVSRKIFGKIMGNRHVKPMREQSVRDAISKIHQKNHGITMNAAAYVFAKKKGFGLYGYLSPEDKSSLQYHKTTSPQEPSSAKSRPKTVAVKDIKADFESRFISGANANAKAYPYIYILENTLRTTILERFAGKPDWWKDQAIVKKDIQDYAARIHEAEQKYPWMKDRGDHPIWYVGLFELFKIVEKNWKSHFEEIFADLEQLRAWIKESVPIRNCVAHNVSIRDQERDLIKKNADYICRLVEKWHKKNAESKS